MAFPLGVVFSASLGSAAGDEDVDLAVEATGGPEAPPARVRVYREREVVMVEVSLDVAAAQTMESDSQWRQLAQDLRPVAQSLAMEVSIATWRPLGLLSCQVLLSDGREWNPSCYYDLSAEICAGPLRVQTDGLNDSLGGRALAESVTGVILAQAPAIEDPLAQYVCVWQALATLIDEDSPAKIDIFLQECGETVLAPEKVKDRPETRFTRLRQQIAHPVDRESSFNDIRSTASLLAPALGRVVLRACRERLWGRVEQRHRADSAR